MCGRNESSVVGEGHRRTKKIFPGERNTTDSNHFLVSLLRIN